MNDVKFVISVYASKVETYGTARVVKILKKTVAQ